MYQRMSDEEIAKYDELYSRTYWLYNPISSAVEDHESRNGGLRAVEVWHEVLELEKRLPKHARMERYIAVERTNLMQLLDGFCVLENGKQKVTVAQRQKEEIERSVMCILLAFGMRLAQYWDNRINPYDHIMERIRYMAIQCDDKQMVWDIANAYYDEEDEEEALLNETAPQEDVLAPHRQIFLSAELGRIRNKMMPIIQYFCNVLIREAGITRSFTYESFAAIWGDILYNEDILREMMITSKIKNTIGEHNPQAPEEVKASDYNLKLILNIIGIMSAEKVIRTNPTNTRPLFFDNAMDKYFIESAYMKFGTGDSGIPTKKMYDDIVNIINKYRTV